MLRSFVILLIATWSIVASSQSQTVLGNFNQPSQGASFTTGVQSWEAIPFVTDSTFTKLEGVELAAATLISPGLFFVEIWDMNAFAQPGKMVQVLSGPSDPSGVTQYTSSPAATPLMPLTSYFIVIGGRNGGSSLGTALYVKDNNQADASPPAIYDIGTDFNNDGVADADKIKGCSGSLNGQLIVSWDCGGSLRERFFPTFRITASPPVAALPALTLSATTLNFGDIPVGSSSAQTLTITNTGGAALTLGTISSDNSDYTLVSDSCSAVSVMAGASCTVGIQFLPSTAGADNGAITIPSNAASSPDIVAVSGNGSLPQVSLSSAALSFGDLPVGSPTAPQSIAVTNTGNAVLILGLLSTSNTEFALSADTCSSQTLAPGANCTAALIFTPTQAGGRTGDLIVPSNALSTPDIAALSGVGDQPDVLLSPTSLNFGPVPVLSSATQEVRISNPGIGDLSITALTASGDFALTSDNCSNSTVAANGSCTFEVIFAPTQVGGRNGSVAVPSDAASTPDTLALLGSGASPLLSLSGYHLAFGDQLIGATSTEQLITATNTGDADLVLGSISSSNPEFSVNPVNSCAGTTITPAAGCTFGVSFTPTASGGQSGTVTINSNDSVSPNTVSVDGTGDETFALTAAPGALDFGEVALNTASTPQTILLTNTGTADQVMGIISASSRFTVTQDDCAGQTLIAAASCALTLTFTPDHSGYTTGTLLVNTNDPLSPYATVLSGSSNALPSTPVRPVPTMPLWILLIIMFSLVMLSVRRLR